MVNVRTELQIFIFKILKSSLYSIALWIPSLYTFTIILL